MFSRTNACTGKCRPVVIEIDIPAAWMAAKNI
jgi:hypothetical protein